MKSQLLVKHVTRITILGALLLFTQNVFAQGFILSVDAIYPATPNLLSHKVVINIDNQVAKVEVEQEFYNSHNTAIEGIYYFKLPEGATVTDFNMFIEGKMVKGELLEKEKASKLYADIVRKKRDPALLEMMGHRVFRAKMFPIPANKKRQIKLEYTQILKNDNGLVKLVYPLRQIFRGEGTEFMNPENPQRPEVSNNYGIGNAPNSSLNHISEVINIKIQSSQALKNIYSPSHKIDITQKSDHSALVSYEGNRSKVMYDFILYYGLDDRDFGINLLTNRVTQDEDGYFMMLLSPKVNIPSYEILAKNLVFVLDVSGSMAGEKIKQAKEALRFCINNLGANDHFNIITFSTEAKLFKKYLVPAAEYKKPALDFINQIEAKGGTNINEALLTALDIKGGKANSQSIVFITDGLPTVGLRDVKEIRKNVKRLNVKNYRIFNFGVGYDVNTQLLDGIAQDNHAVADYIEQNEDIETAISFFYNKIRHPILSTLRLDFGGIEVYDYYPKEVPDLFKGSQLILIGKYKSTGKTKVTLSGQLSNERKSFEYMLNFASLQKENEYLPRLWAARKIGYLLEQIKLNDDGKENRDLIDEIIELSKKFGLVTPYTSYFVNEDENPQFTKLHDHTTQNVLYSFDESALGQAASKANVGKEAIAYSKTTRKLKETEVMDMNKSYNVRYIAGRSFALDKNGYWTDIEFQGAKDLLNIKFGSKAFFQLLKMFPKTKPYLSLTEKVIFKFNGKFIKIDDEGLENITNEKLKKYFSKNH